MNDAQRKNQHLWWRAGFGPATDQVEAIRNHSRVKIFDAMLGAAQKEPALFDVADPSLKSMVMGNEAAASAIRKNLSAEEKKNYQETIRAGYPKAQYPLVAGNDGIGCAVTGKNVAVLARAFCQQDRQYFL